MNQICQEPIADSPKVDSSISKPPQFRLVHRLKFEELEEYHYCPIPKFSNYIKTEWLDETSNDSQKIFTRCLAYSAKISRKILRGIKYQTVIDTDISIVSSIIDAGIWGEEGTTRDRNLSDEEIAEITRIYALNNSAEVKFREI